jgi:hypothetical protein
MTEKINIPNDIIELLKKDDTLNKITYVTPKDIRQALLRIDNGKHCNYLEYANQILEKLNNPLIKIDSEECVICFEMVDQMINLKCNHKFCKSCIDKMNTQKMIKCPLCRNDQIYSKPKEFSDKQINNITEHFDKNKNEYKLNENYFVPFETIIEDIIDSNICNADKNIQ